MPQRHSERQEMPRVFLWCWNWLSIILKYWNIIIAAASRHRFRLNTAPGRQRGGENISDFWKYFGKNKKYLQDPRGWSGEAQWDYFCVKLFCSDQPRVISRTTRDLRRRSWRIFCPAWGQAWSPSLTPSSPSPGSSRERQSQGLPILIP